MFSMMLVQAKERRQLDTSNNPIAGDLMGIFEYGAGALDVMAVLVP